MLYSVRGWECGDAAGVGWREEIVDEGGVTKQRRRWSMDVG
jgi:hypothetical protein